MPLIVGLGNPGDKHILNRHNIGFMIVDRLAKALPAHMEQTPGDPFIIGTGRFKGIETTLIKPVNYMNNSGKAVLKACRMLNLLPGDILVCCDDIHLPVGQIRLRKEGGAGGHNGIQSIIDFLNTTHFPRLRFGIGDNFQQGKQSDYVLSPFDEEELPIINEGLQKAREAIFLFLRKGIYHAMNEYNKKT